MLKVTSAILFVLAIGFNAPAYAAGCNPNDNEVALYQHVNFKGICSVIGLGKYRNAAAMRVKNDSVSSIKVGKNVQIRVCQNALGVLNKQKIPGVGKITGKKKQGGCFTVKHSLQRLGNYGGRDFNDTISSATVARRTTGDVLAAGECYPGDGGSKIAIYQLSGLAGTCRILGVGGYENSKQMNFKNDSVTSIEIGRNSKVYAVICSDSKYRGRCENIKQTDVYLGDNLIGDNKLTSIKVIRKR